MTLSPFSRRGFLGLAALAAAAPSLAACSTGGGSTGGSAIKFWDMPWGTPDYNAAAEQIVAGYTPAEGGLATTYQTIQWNNFYQTFASAIASNTGPAVSSGAGFQAFQFEEQGAIAYADNVIETLKTNGVYDDFLPGILEPFNTEKGYIAVPWNLDIRVPWYRKSLFDRAGVEPPTDWNGILEAGKALKGIGAVGFATGAGSGNFFANHAIVSMMINNGGGIWNEGGELDVVTDRNLETVEFLYELGSNGILDPSAVSYNDENLANQWKDTSRAAYGSYAAGLPNRIAEEPGDLFVAPVVTGPHGDVGTVMFPNNLMMYKNTPSQEASEAFLVYYMTQLPEFWKQGLLGSLPVLKSITELPEFASDENNVRIINEWQPIARTLAAQGGALNADIAVLDGGQAINQFAQTVVSGGGDAASALRTLQDGIASALGS